MASAAQSPADKGSGKRAFFANERVTGHVHPLIRAALIFSLAVVLTLDLYTPLGVEVWVFFLIPVTLSLALWYPWAPTIMAGVATALMIYTFMTDAPGIDRELAMLNRGFGILIVWIMAGVGWFFVSNRIVVSRQHRLQACRTGLAEVISGEQQPEQFGANVLRFLAEFLDAQAGAIFVADEEGFSRLATYGVPAAAQLIQRFSIGDGLLGQAVKDGRSFLVKDVPQGYLQIGSALGQTTPLNLLIAPVRADGQINGVLEFGFLRAVGAEEQALLDEVAEALGIAIRSGNYRRHLQTLLDETRRQTAELQSQSEELRTANEELEEQSGMLQRSHEHLEHQQSTLEQSNMQLEEQTQLLENQRDELAMARAALEIKAQELERVSQYKSDFLANMSHELRTPLNSSLILARLLADNADHNLTPAQVSSAGTIVAAGNDLLALINDILDLSRIEAGRMDVHSEPVWLAPLVKNLGNAMRPQAEDKGLDFETRVEPGCPESLSTDHQRLEQILKNLLSNAIKFTEEGAVSLGVGLAPEGRIAFAVTDSGIGIPEDQHQSIFDAFHQIDSAVSRRYNGTGLGLSISRELVRLLGGEIRVASNPDKGSTFTVLLPQTWEPPLLARPVSRHGVAPPTEKGTVDQLPLIERRRNRRPSAEPLHPAHEISDDRQCLQAGHRLLLIVEDDASFATILRDLAHESGFQCLIATTSDEAVELARQYLPGAVLLDIGLPDHCGLSVLDRLKEDPRTRHIAVHVISADDHSATALALGAVGYQLKPASREELCEALRNLETRLDQRMRRVLVVENDAAQLEQLRAMLANQGVETTGVSTTAECLAQLATTTFDCMVVDLSGPGTADFTLLESLSQDASYSFPPVIVYLGTEATAEQERRLRQYSRSLIIKGAKSPERLLDEVTLFLHQVVAELPAEQQNMIRRSRSRESALEGRRILIVEDDVRNVFALSSILEPWGALVQIARNGREALDALDLARGNPERHIDLVLMDVMMPEMDGLTATREIRRHPEWKTLPVIMLTANAMKEDQQACFSAGANDFMVKPLDVDKLLSLVRVWMRK